jgi:hypothetical protein
LLSIKTQFADTALKTRPNVADGRNVGARLSILVAVTLPLTAVDLAAKAVLPTDAGLYHLRSRAWELGSAALVAAAVALCRLPSRLLAAGTGVFSAGLAGNLVSALGHGGAVPNPFVAGTVAFTLADILQVAGLVLLGAAGMRLARRHRHLLPTATIPVRIVRYVRSRGA